MAEEEGKGLRSIKQGRKLQGGKGDVLDTALLPGHVLELKKRNMKEWWSPADDPAPTFTVLPMQAIG